MKVILEDRLATGGLGTVKGKVKGYLYSDKPQKQKWVIVDVRDLKDGRGNSFKTYQKKIKSVVRMLEQNKKVVICCKGGRSRSMAIALGVLVVKFKFTFKKALERVNAMGAKIHRVHLKALREIFS